MGSANLMRRILALAILFASPSAAQNATQPAPQVCIDECGCGTKGCEALRLNAKCNSWQDHAWRTSACGKREGVLDCAYKTIRRKPAELLKIAKCELGLGPRTATTVASSVLAFLAWLPLLSWTMQ
jgi:hypothetical protein